MAKVDKKAAIKWDGKKREIAEILANPDISMSNNEIYTMMGMSAATYYRLIRNPLFIEYVNEMVDRYTDAKIGSAWKKLLDNVDNGETPAIKLFFELKNRYKQNIEVSGNIEYVIKPLEEDDMNED